MGTLQRLRGPRAAVSLVLAAACVGAAASVACSLVLDRASLRADGGGSDAAGDGGEAGPSPDASGCDATFCEDFDMGALGARWTSNVVDDGGALSLGGPARSPPNALRAAVPDGSPRERRALLTKDFDPASRLRCSFSVQTDLVPPAGKGADLFYVTFAGGNAFVDSDLLLAIDQAGLGARQDVLFADGGCACPGWETTAAPISQSLWTRITLETDFASVKVWVEDQEVLSRPITGAGPTRSRISFGLRAWSSAGAAVRLDDLSCTTTP